jgi:hypothetical protein
MNYSSIRTEPQTRILYGTREIRAASSCKLPHRYGTLQRQEQCARTTEPKANRRSLYHGFVFSLLRHLLAWYIIISSLSFVSLEGPTGYTFCFSEAVTVWFEIVPGSSPRTNRGA